MTNGHEQQLGKASGLSRRLLAVLVGLLATLGLIVSGAAPASAQNVVGPQPVNSILTVGPHNTAGQENIGVRGPPGLRRVSATGVAAEDAPEEVSLYRGVAADHPGYDDALNGVAHPRGGPATAAEHNLGDTRSEFTSWTTDPEVAKGMSYPGSVVMRIPQSSVSGRLVESPDLFDESEVLIRGSVFGAELLP